MASTTTAQNVDRPGHRRNKSSSVLKSIMAPKSHKRSPSDGTALGDGRYDPRAMANPQSLLPPDHPHNKQRARPWSQHGPSNQTSAAKPQDIKESPKKSLHKKTLSSVSLRSLANKDKNKDKQSKDPSRTRDESPRKSEKPREKKSSSNLAAMFQKSKSSRGDKKSDRGQKDKENTTPPSTGDPTQMQTPIWAQFSSRAFTEVTTTSKVPLNDRRSIEEEIKLYTPKEYSPSDQRNFYDYGQPSLRKRTDVKERPKSTVLPASTSASSFLENLTRKMSGDRTPLSDTKGNEDRRKQASQQSSRPFLKRASSDSHKSKQPQPEQAPPNNKMGSRVMAAVAAFNSKARDQEPVRQASVPLDPKKVEAEFEAVLESRNIPHHQRAQMRTLTLTVKANFVRNNKLDTPQGSRATSGYSTTSEKATKPLSSKAKPEDQNPTEGGNVDANAENAPKRSRPRSRTFTFSRGSSPSKKQKAEDKVTEKSGSKFNPIPKSPSTRSLVSIASQKSQRSSAPTEYVQYLKGATNLKKVEVGKLHKLRLLLRNETVEWVDSFIDAGGMLELVGLLHRIMEVEWREEHEDTLLHETLRALKGLCTTSHALSKLRSLSPTLFPPLLAMLFDEEHKGPSEFTTRELIINLLFLHLSSASESELPSRASEILSYLKDPVKEKESSTIPFILEMHQPRPYQVWCKEVTNVTKEVFWIFIHHLNVIPLPSPSSNNSGSSSGSPQSYHKTHFPGPRAIVPAAPYVGGVEWDATNYIASHLDLLNGLIASLPTTTARNALRSDLKASGFEKLMGQLRACNPKYYGAVHDSVKVWIGAAVEDGWGGVKSVRMGDSRSAPRSPVKNSPVKKKVEKAPQLDLQVPPPKMGSLGLGIQVEGGENGSGNWNGGKKDDDWF